MQWLAWWVSVCRSVRSVPGKLCASRHRLAFYNLLQTVFLDTSFIFWQHLWCLFWTYRSFMVVCNQIHQSVSPVDFWVCCLAGKDSFRTNNVLGLFISHVTEKQTQNGLEIKKTYGFTSKSRGVGLASGKSWYSGSDGVAKDLGSLSLLGPPHWHHPWFYLMCVSFTNIHSWELGWADGLKSHLNHPV